ncbi:YjeF [Pyricularia oryzae 70-15]|uniref:ATP-dependent (S)-NAD(P)H-hydrate dehydratase n=1 Tax=Pyricularia oryzae (strain 70-15 / ATCC MYA-4617 / FGSC 8958) TaxID=242507 RepID=G4N0M6_PYRO7|nr:YjeF [Pyricularia oryzae 70-15]EHA53157.1 YjeF [Pyricularia oryzae 70-15]KAI7915859.1 YjeF [Pyricularia oryzae]KAI7917272.1 YjeF [Pyricularia oryzae]
MSTDTEPQMSAATRGVMASVRRLVPPMLDKFHKGQLGRVGVIGGSEDYTGAPYFSAMASARLGCDMSHVICTPAAAAVIKTYSPNLMVHPLMRQTSSDGSSTANNHDQDPDKVASPIIQMLSRLHVLVIGPGLGRDPLMQATCARVVAAARERNMPLVLDADALQLVQRDPALVKGYKLAVLTPNVVEFRRLASALGIEDAKEGDTATARADALARALGGVMIVQKGGKDIVSDGGDRDALVVDLEGGKKRSGGQGDTLTGCIATMLAWRKAALDGLWEGSSEEWREGTGEAQGSETVRLAAFGGCAVTRECSRLAFAKKGRSLQASDLTDEVHQAFLNLLGEEEGNDAKL